MPADVDTCHNKCRIGQSSRVKVRDQHGATNQHGSVRFADPTNTTEWEESSCSVHVSVPGRSQRIRAKQPYRWKKWGKRGRPAGMYVCAQHRTRGDAACVNRLGVPAVELTDQVLAQIKKAFLDPIALGALLMKRFNEAKAAPEALEAERKDVTSRIAKLTQEIDRLIAAVATGAAPASIVQAITDREGERRDLQAKLEHLSGLQLATEEFDAPEFIEEIREVLDDLRSSLEADVVRGRRTLQRLLTAPITVTPTPTGFEFAGAASWLGYDEQLRAAVMKKEQLTGRLERRHRRSQIWWPRGELQTVYRGSTSALPVSPTPSRVVWCGPEGDADAPSSRSRADA